MSAPLCPHLARRRRVFVPRGRLAAAALGAAAVLLPGCTGRPAESPAPAAATSAADQRPATSRRENVSKQAGPPARSLADLLEQAKAADPPATPDSDSGEAPAETAPPFAQRPPRGTPRTWSAEELRTFGLRRLQGRHLTLLTDLPADEAIDRLPALFDAAVAAWCAYFQLEPQSFADWHVSGCLMRRREVFTRAGLLPPELPPFLHGYATADRLWLDEQPGEYYRRHLLLHEGVHAFMSSAFGVHAPPWYAEGMAELLATHHTGDDGALVLPFFPRQPDDVPLLGRIKLVQDAVAAGQPLSLVEVFRFGPRAHLRNEPYAWSWAAAAFLDGHPRYRARFRRLAGRLRSVQSADEFQRAVAEAFAADWNQLQLEWDLFARQLEHGHDLPRTALDFTPGEPITRDEVRVQVAADRGWQNTGLWLEPGRTYRLRATGRYKIAHTDRPWPCEPGGVTLRYYRGHPLGMVLAAVYAGADQPENPFLSPIAIGLDGTLRSPTGGTLYLRVNDSAGQLHDNTGHCQVHLADDRGGGS